MKIESLTRPWEKNKSQGHKIHNDPFYQSSTWKRTVDRIWIRDASVCQLCKEKGINHPLERGTKDLEKQGTVDHKVQRMNGGADTDDNLWLIGSNHHNVKRAEEKNAMQKKK
jgi:5-methylcytosine-specific restriction endonuclease McrA